MSEVLQLCHHSFLGHKLVNFDLLFELGVVHIVSSKLLNEVVHESSHEGLLSCQRVGSLFARFILSEFDEFDVTERDSEDGHVPKRCVFRSTLDRGSDFLVLASLYSEILLLFFFLAFGDLSRSFEVVWCGTIHILLYLVDLEIAADISTIL